MKIEKLLNEYKDKISRFEVYENHLIIHLKDNGRVEFDTGSPLIHFNIEHIVNS